VTDPLQILLLEDDPGDAELIQELLEVDHFVGEVTRVQTRTEFLAALENVDVDLILADYKLPSFDGLSALKLAQSARPDLPFIFVSGTIGEDVAIEALKIGATDYVLKTRLSRLVPAMQRALREAREKAERKKAEEALRRSEMYLAEAQRLSHTGTFGWDVLSGEIYWSDETYRIFECERATKPTVQMMIDRTHPDDRMLLRQIIDRASIERSGFSAEHRLMIANGSVKYLRVVAHRARGEDPESVFFIGAVTISPRASGPRKLCGSRLICSISLMTPSSSATSMESSPTGIVARRSCTGGAQRKPKARLLASC
jgi:CheY-like chemotaxis protein